MVTTNDMFALNCVTVIRTLYKSSVSFGNMEENIYFRSRNAVIFSYNLALYICRLLRQQLHSLLVKVIAVMQ